MKRALYLAIGLLVAATAVEAAPKLGAYAIPGVFEPDRTGSYDKALARIASETGFPLDYVVLAPGRVKDDFTQRKLDCVIPLDARFWSSTEKVTNSEPLNIARIYVFSRAGEGPYTSVEQLKGKRVGARRGMPYGPKYDKSGIAAELVNDDGQNVQKLNAKRIDAFFAYVPDMWQWASKSKQQLPNYDKEQPFEIHNDAFLCRDSAATREFLKAFNAAVVKIRASGELQKILGSSYVP